MCRPPDLLPGAGAADFEDDNEEWEQDAAVLEAAAAQLQASASVLGKRQLGELVADDISASAKLQKAHAPVSLAFDSAAASFMAKMEQSLLQDLQRKQQQRNLAAAAAAETEEALLQKALLMQQAKVQELQQLQQLQLLNQLQSSNKQVQAPMLLPEQQQLLLAQQQLLLQAQGKMALPPFAAAPASSLLNPAAALASVVKSEPQWTTAPAATSLQPKLLQPAPPAGLASMLAAKANPAALLGLGVRGLSAYQTAAQALEDDKKVKRMQSNRASAKRSRQRRQARLEELDKSTGDLQAENHALCDKLEQAQHHILDLEEKNRSLVGEVAGLRKMLGMSAYSSSTDCDKESSEGAPSHCIISESCGHGSSGSAPVVKETGLDDHDGVDQLSCLLDLDNADSCLDQLLPQGDVLSELLACLEG